MAEYVADNQDMCQIYASQLINTISAQNMIFTAFISNDSLADS